MAAELGQLLEECMRQANIGSDSALDEVVVATFGPCRPKTRRDRDRLHRGFAVRTFASADAAAAIIAAAHGKTMKTTSPRGGERKINARLDEKNECDVAFCKGLRGSKPVVKEKVKCFRIFIYRRERDARTRRGGAANGEVTSTFSTNQRARREH